MLEPEDLLKFGLIPEFVGRLPVIATLRDLDEEALVDDPLGAEERAGQAVSAAVRDGGREAHLHQGRAARRRRRAIERKTGARGLRSILEDVLLETMFDLPDMDGVEEVVVNDEVIVGRGQAAADLRGCAEEPSETPRLLKAERRDHRAPLRRRSPCA
jgi:ATP-dependent Clp protease ATP-binding subunit ClpX